jgi:hypothetical protein
VERVVAANSKVRDAQLDWNDPVRTLRLDLDQDTARALGLTPAEIAIVTQSLMNGATLSQLHEGEDLIDCRLSANRRDPAQPMASRLRLLNPARAPGIDAYEQWQIQWQMNRSLRRRPKLAKAGSFAGDPLPICLDPLRARRPGVRKWEMEDGNRLLRAAAPADRHDLLIVCHINPFDGGCGAEDLGFERRIEMLVEQRVEAHALLRFVVSVDDRFLDQRSERGLRPRFVVALCAITRPSGRCRSASSSYSMS